jgi:hypothetical protein
MNNVVKNGTELHSTIEKIQAENYNELLKNEAEEEKE